MKKQKQTLSALVLSGVVFCCLFNSCSPKVAVAPVSNAAVVPSSTFLSWANTPPRGWNSYDAYYGAITEDQFKECVDTLAKKLLPYGWEYAVIDWAWYHPGTKGWSPKNWKPFPLLQRKDSITGKLTPQMAIDAYGRHTPALNRFPSAANGAGLKPVADYVHAKGMKFGIHIMRGVPREAVQNKLPILGTSFTAADIAEPWDTCVWNNTMYGIDASKPGAQEYYNSIINLYAAWGVDYIKMDDAEVPAYQQGEIELIRRAIDQCGRPIVLSLSCGEAPIGQAHHLEKNANLYRISKDFWDEWEDLRHLFDLLNIWSPFIGNGSWPDADMIPFGRLCLRDYPGAQINPENPRHEHDDRFTPAERKTLMTLWAISRSPMMWGGDPLKSGQETYSLLNNREVLEVNSTSQNNHQLYQSTQGNNEQERIWVATIPGSADVYVALFNLQDKERDVKFVLEWENLRGNYTLRDLWQQSNIGEVNEKVTATLPPHGAMLYRLVRK